jgi:hypothetical protein
MCEPEAPPGGMHCTARDISFGGFGFEASAPLVEDQTYQFLIHLHVSGLGPTKVKARIRWVCPSGSGFVMGAEFLESSKGWFGPEEDSLGK